MANENRKGKDGSPVAGTRVTFCSCVHSFQDAFYGEGRRLHNETKTGCRCTVCGFDKKE